MTDFVPGSTMTAQEREAAKRTGTYPYEKHSKSYEEHEDEKRAKDDARRARMDRRKKKKKLKRNSSARSGFSLKRLKNTIVGWFK